MSSNQFGIKPVDYNLIMGIEKKKKRVKLTPGERIKIWEHPKKYGRTCSICREKITKLSELQLDHTRPYSKGGTKLNLAHADCNRIKGSRNLRYVQKRMGIKPKGKKKSTKRKVRKRQEHDIFGLPRLKAPKLDFGI